MQVRCRQLSRAHELGAGRTLAGLCLLYCKGVTNAVAASCSSSASIIIHDDREVVGYHGGQNVAMVHGLVCALCGARQAGIP